MKTKYLRLFRKHYQITDYHYGFTKDFIFALDHCNKDIIIMASLQSLIGRFFGDCLGIGTWSSWEKRVKKRIALKQYKKYLPNQ